MKGKYISALAGIAAAALLSVPGVASASTAGPAKSVTLRPPSLVRCTHKHLAWYDIGKRIWVLEGHGTTMRCKLVALPRTFPRPIHRGNSGHQGQRGHGGHRGHVVVK
jgi:hypothetical protein